MKTPCLCSVLITVIIICVNCPTYASEPLKPIVEQTALAAVPGSVDEFWSTAELVARVRIESSHMRGIGTSPMAVTEHRAVVLRVFKGDVKIGSTIAFEQAAGDLELPDKVIHVVGATPFQTRREYVVFLRNWPAASAYTLVGDRAGAFKIVHGVVEPQGGGEVAEDHRNLSEKRFTEELERTANRNRQPK